MSDHIAAENILGERGLRYKRNVLAVALITTVILWTGVSLADFSFLGVSLKDSKSENKELAARLVLVGILAYQWAMLAYYGLTDLRVWRVKVFSQWEAPVRSILLWVGNGMEYELFGRDVTVISVRKTSTEFEWWAVNSDRFVDPGYKPDQNHADKKGTISHNDRALIRRRVLAFALLEFGPAFVWGAGCLLVAGLKMAGWV